MSGYQGSAASARPASVNGAQANASTPGLVKMLTAPGIAPADTAVRGDDYRLRSASGGVHLDGGMAGGYAKWWPASYAYNVPNFTVFLRVQRVGVTGGPRQAFVSGDDLASLVISTLDDGRVRVARRNTSYFLETAVGLLPIGETVALVYVRSASVGTLYANGVVVGTAADTNTYSGNITIGDAASPLAGVVVEFRALSRAISLAEVADLGAGRPSLALYQRAASNAAEWVNAPPEFVAQGGFGFSSFASSGGGANLSVAAAPGAFSGAGVYLPPTLGRVRVSGSVDSFSGQGYFSSILAGNAWTVIEGTAVDSFGFVVGTGAFTIEGAFGGANPGILFRTSNSACTAALRALTVENVGVRAAYAPADVVRSGRWLDSSGNFKDLLTSGRVFALQPVESYTRVFPGTVTATLPGLDAGGYNEASPLVASTSPALAAVQAGDVVSVSFDAAPPAGVYIRASQKAPSAGQVPVLLGGPTESDPLVLSAVPVTITHIVN